MAVTKQKDGRWLVSCRPQGVAGVHVRRICKTRSLGVSLERDLMNAKVSTLDNSPLSACVDTWYDYWGVNLKDSKRRKAKLDLIVNKMGDFKVSKFKPQHYLEFRKQRLDDGISKNTCNHDLVYLKTVFNKLLKAEYLSGNPIADISPFKLDEYELSFLTDYQMKRLLVACRKSINESLFPVVCLCLSTGARWSEAEKLTFNQLSFNSVNYTKTKNGKSRRIPIDSELFKFLNQRKRFGTVRVFANCLSAFRSAVKRAKIILPAGQMSHVLRHTFASHFVMNGGDISTLQKVLGHSDIKVTMRYAHLSEDHLRDAIQYNPLSSLKQAK